ncbi:TrmH family RNA methyltransferase [Oricola cellulosilytica]|uniref:RNA methyltransferase n=1 Tax=Oricola cellulosilytica TaxID=1429082 RepID=A0A4R0PD11_9HYPH|nr:RNA methyltransferase [Oricola cellulosilytica]TCD15372.1 RNA methyltransferase [Oricola cellulosilytica]
MTDRFPIPIDDPSDPRVEPYRDIRERDLVKRHGMFIAEGRTVLQVLVAQNRFPVRSALILENRLSGVWGLLQELPLEVPVYVATQQVMDAVAGFHIHRGILAIGAIPTTINPLQTVPAQWRTILVLAGISNHDNMGAIFRNAAAFGVDGVLLDGECCDPLYRKALRVSVGGVLKVPFHQFSKFTDIIGLLEGNRISIAALSPSGSEEIAHWTPEERQALVLGSEGHGLDQRWLEKLRTLRIAMDDGFDSVNVATAGALALYRIRSLRT